MNVWCVCLFGVIYTYVIEGRDSKVNSVYLINDYLLFADLHIFVYESAECASILLECTKVKLLILHNFGYDWLKSGLILPGLMNFIRLESPRLRA